MTTSSPLISLSREREEFCRDLARIRLRIYQQRDHRNHQEARYHTQHLPRSRPDVRAIQTSGEGERSAYAAG